VRRIAHDQTRRIDYYAEAHASTNRTFDKLVFGSNWRDPGVVATTDSIHAFVVELP
jgi:hypothetical protein